MIAIYTASAILHFALQGISLTFLSDWSTLQMCSEGDSCTRELCFFAHNKSQLRYPTPYEDIPALKAKMAETSIADIQAACKRLGFALDSRPVGPQAVRERLYMHALAATILVLEWDTCSAHPCTTALLSLYVA